MAKKKKGLKIGSLYRIECTGHIARSVFIQKPLKAYIYNRRFEDGDVILQDRMEIGSMNYDTDMFVVLEDGYDMFHCHCPKILTSTGIVGYLRIYSGSAKFIEVEEQ